MPSPLRSPVLAAALLTSAIAAVGHADPAPRYVDARRFDQVVFDLEVLRDLPAERSARHRMQLERAGGSLTLRSTAAPNGHLEWSTELAAADVDELVLSAHADRPAIVRLLWRRRRDERFEFARHVEWRLDGAQRSVLDVARSLRRHPDWSGTIRTLRLQIEAAEPAAVTIERFEARGFAGEQLAAAFAGEQRLAVRAGLETRPAVHLPDGAAATLEVPAGRHWLRGAAANLGRGPVALHVVFHGADDRILQQQSIEVPRTREWWTPIRLPVDASEPLRVRIASEGGDLLWSSLGFGPREPAPAARVVLVSLDTVRRDAIGLHGDNATPHLDALGASAWVFDDAYAPAPWTLPSHMTMLTGLAPARHGVEASERPLPPGVWTLAEALAARGFETVAVTEGGFVDPRFGFHRGFDRYVSWDGNHRFEASIEIAERTLAEATGPVFLFLHTYQAHTPYEPESGGALDREAAKALTDAWLAEPRRLAEPELEGLVAAYRSGVRRLDDLFGAWLAALDALPGAEPEVLVVTSDHGEAFHERDDFLLHAEHLYPELLAVPLVVRSSARPGHGRIAGRAGLADIAPTVLELLGIAEAPAFDGRSLAGAMAPEGVLPQRTLAASTQSSRAAYRLGAIGPEAVDVRERDALGETRERSLPLARPSIEPLDPARRPTLDRLWREAQRGRWEIDLRLATPRTDLALDLESDGEIRDVLWLPAADNVVYREGPGHVAWRHRSSRPQAWTRLLVELVPADAGLRIRLADTGAEVRLQCGGLEEAPASAEACHSAATAAAGRDGGRRAAPDPEESRLRVQRWPGPALGVARAEEGADAGVDAGMAARLAALGYLDVPTEATAPDGSAGPSKAGPPPPPRSVELVPLESR